MKSDTERDMRSVSSGPKPPNQPPIPSWLIAYLNPKNWPNWLKYVVAPIFFIGLVFYYRDQRVGNGIFASIKEEEIGSSLKTRQIIRGGRLIEISYADGTIHPADGLAIAVVTKEDDTKAPERLAPFKGLIKDTDWPVAVFLNASGFDTTGEPVVIRRVADGKELFRAPVTDKVVLGVVQSDNKFKVYLGDGTTKVVDEKFWVEKYMRMQHTDPKDLEKMSDEELAKLGLRRAVPKGEEKSTPPKGPQLRVIQIPLDKLKLPKLKLPKE
jgi:hypothetical protein